MIARDPVNVVKITFAKGAPRWATLQARSTPASKATPTVPSISMTGTRLTKRSWIGSGGKGYLGTIREDLSVMGCLGRPAFCRRI